MTKIMTKSIQSTLALSPLTAPNSILGLSVAQSSMAQEIRATNSTENQIYLEAKSLFNMAIASCTVVINCAGKIMVEFFSVAISAIVCSVRS